MPSSQSISRALFVVLILLSSYFIGLTFGNGLHLHESLTHEHDGASSHEHSWAAHVHETAITPSATPVDEEISAQKTAHDHAVPVVHIVAVPASSSTPTNSVLNVFAGPGDVVESSLPFFSISLLLPRETSPPLPAQTHFSNLGRSPPIFS